MNQLKVVGKGGGGGRRGEEKLKAIFHIKIQLRYLFLTMAVHQYCCEDTINITQYVIVISNFIFWSFGTKMSFSVNGNE